MPFSLPEANRLKVFGRKPSIPPGLRVYAVGDIHGRLDLLDDLLSRIDADIAARPASRLVYVFLGDYIDRGTSSRETIDRLIKLSEARDCVYLKGNHELIALKCLSDRILFDQWMRLGGVETLMSYGIFPGQAATGKTIVELQAALHHALPQTHLRFFRDLQPSFECGDFFFAHAGIRPGVDLSRQTDNDLLWIRDDFLSSDEDFNKIIVHGHTPSRTIEVKPNRINIDTGAYTTGRLTCSRALIHLKAYLAW